MRACMHNTHPYTTAPPLPPVSQNNNVVRESENEEKEEELKNVWWKAHVVHMMDIAAISLLVEAARTPIARVQIVIETLMQWTHTEFPSLTSENFVRNNNYMYISICYAYICMCTLYWETHVTFDVSSNHGVHIFFLLPLPIRDIFQHFFP